MRQIFPNAANWPDASCASGLFVTGAPRSGTTWVGRMLALGEHYYYIHEPFNNRLRRQYPEIYGPPFAWFYPCMGRNSAGHLIAPFMDWVTGAGRPAAWSEDVVKTWSKAARAHLHELELAMESGSAPLVKDPVGVLALEWVLARYNLPVLAMVRHPAEFVRSILRLGWHAGPGFFLRQGRLMNTLPEAISEQVKALHGSQDPLRKAALMWKVMNFHIARVAASQPGRVLLVRHEDLAARPYTGFAALLELLGIHEPAQLDALDYWCGEQNPAQPRSLWVIRRNSRRNYDRWQQFFSDEELAVIEEITGPVSRQFGYTFDAAA